MKRICVFCGSSPGARPEYMQAAKKLGAVLAQRKLVLVYGGSSVGTMGELARSVIEQGGEVIGIITQELVDRKVAFTGLSDLRVVGSMHERKALMAELADGFIALPGGIGTLDEFFEVWTWAQLGLHPKPCGLLNICGYYGKLMGFLDHVADEKFLAKVHRSMIMLDEEPAALLDRFAHYKAPKMDKAAWTLRMEQ
ncbi:MAG: TIGR00730 family Rossman fold protein [Elusimicrobiota bacterium]